MKTKTEINWKDRAQIAEKKLREATDREIHLVAMLNSREGGEQFKISQLEQSLRIERMRTKELEESLRLERALRRFDTT